jgi:VIT1/CCC1 family predicted Fe2+/Mn2+ transporter
MAASEIAAREPEHPNAGRFLRDIVFGANDGVVTAIGFLVGIAGSVQEQGIVVVAGVLTIIAGATSMALGNYLAVKSQNEFYDAMEKVEKWEIENKREKEIDEIREIYTNVGLDRESVEKITQKVITDKKLWLKVMMRDELGLLKDDSPKIAGVLIGVFYLLAGLPPLLPFIFIRPILTALYVSLAAAVGVMILIGALRWYLNKGNLFGKVVETIVIGLVAAGVGFVAGEALKIFGVTGVSI